MHYPPSRRRKKTSAPTRICYIFTALIIFWVIYNIVISEPIVVDTEEVYKGWTNETHFAVDKFYRKSSHATKRDDVTIITQVSVDRLSRIADMADTWQGPISVAVYVQNKTKELPIIDEMFSSHDSLQEFVDIHLLHFNKTRYPVNFLRNLALDTARTSLIFNLDADFITSVDMHEQLSDIGKLELLSTEEEAKIAYVVPAFSSSLPPAKLPRTKPALLSALSNKTVDLVNEKACPKCHKPTNYTHWYNATEPYGITYRWIFEPYIMFNKDYLPEKWDERFIGYGFDKNSHIFALAAAGYKFVVLPSAFVIHMNHPVTEWDGPEIDRQLWDALTILCDMIPNIKRKYGHTVYKRLFDEPLQSECMSRSHW